jgi:hypothetical protein
LTRIKFVGIPGRSRVYPGGHIFKLRHATGLQKSGKDQ